VNYPASLNKTDINTQNPKTLKTNKTQKKNKKFLDVGSIFSYAPGHRIEKLLC
jgi:hypothetical protein